VQARPSPDRGIGLCRNNGDGNGHLDHWRYWVPRHIRAITESDGGRLKGHGLRWDLTIRRPPVPGVGDHPNKKPAAAGFIKKASVEAGFAMFFFGRKRT